ncbi:MAG: 1-(5-phosphoribosyl)-5-[Clostridia bacterium]|nr:1-(5-phosphoribosyl)-5-[(5-phosphoribosylamino)methylideneamino]imidazole-4-carboxamide isomerase [Clostridia bacterium]
MDIFPAIDLYKKKAVRLKRGDYSEMTVYSDDPISVARSFFETGAEFLHTVDLEGAKDGTTPNFEIIKDLALNSGLKVEIGGGIRDSRTVERYLDAGVWRVILGTAAISDPEFLDEMLARYGERIAVGVDIKDGLVAVHGWREVTGRECFDFCRELENKGVSTVICTDISCDGMLGGTNIGLYRRLVRKFKMKFVASGGVSTTDDIETLKEMGISGAILGRALYEKTLDLGDALKAAK